MLVQAAFFLANTNELDYSYHSSINIISSMLSVHMRKKRRRILRVVQIKNGRRETEREREKREEFYIVLLNIHQRIPAISLLTSYDFSRFPFYYYCNRCSISLWYGCLICILFLEDYSSRFYLLTDIFNNEFRSD